jgi:hypothetical protein
MLLYLPRNCRGQTEEAVTREEKCRKVAEWLGYVAVDCRIEYHGPRCWRFNDQHILRLPDFYSDEAANALVLEAMPEHTKLMRGTQWAIEIWNGTRWITASDPDRKTAIVEACLKLIESEGR